MSTTSLSLRDYQQAGIDALRAGSGQHLRQILSVPTGGGKTEMACAIAELAYSRGNRVWFIVDKITLASQAKARFEKYGMKVGILQGENTDRSADDQVVVSTIQTLSARFEKNPTMLDADIIVIDEVHVFHQMHKKVLDYRTVPCIGLSATPHNASLGLYFTNVVAPVTVRELVDAGHLMAPQIYAPTEPDLDGVRFQRGDFVESDLEDKMTRITGDVVAHWQRLAPGRPTIAFCVNVNHAREMAQEFVSAGVPAEVVHGGTPLEEREELFRQLAAGDIQVLTSVYVLGVGFDLPEASCAILARPTASEALHIQQCGRVLRVADGKPAPIILDHAGNTLRHGRPQDYIPPALGEVESRVRKERVPSERPAARCSSCGYILEPGVMECPKCLAIRQSRSQVVTVDGRLVEIDTPDIGAEAPMSRRQVLKELMGIAEIKGFKRGWAVHQYEDRYGCQPWKDGAIQRYKSITATPPSPETIRWVENRRKYHYIRKMKGRQGTQ